MIVKGIVTSREVFFCKTFLIDIVHSFFPRYCHRLAIFLVDKHLFLGTIHNNIYLTFCRLNHLYRYSVFVVNNLRLTHIYFYWLVYKVYYLSIFGFLGYRSFRSHIVNKSSRNKVVAYNFKLGTSVQLVSSLLIVLTLQQFDIVTFQNGTCLKLKFLTGIFHYHILGKFTRFAFGITFCHNTFRFYTARYKEIHYRLGTTL